MLRDIYKHLHCACAETAIYELSVKNLTLPFAPTTDIVYNTGITLLSAYIFAVFYQLLWCTCAQISLILLPV